MALSQTQQSVFWIEAETIQGAQQLTSTGFTQIFGGYNFAEPPADGDAMRITVNLDPGVYSMLLQGVRGVDSPIVDVYFDSVLEFSQDRYLPSLTFNAFDTFGVTINNNPTVIDFVVNGKNTLAFNYYLSLTRVYFEKI